METQHQEVGLDGLGLLLGALTPDILGATVAPEELAAALRGAHTAPPAEGIPHWAVMLDVAAAALGLRVRWLQADMELVSSLARPDLPLVTFAGSWSGGQWLSVSDAALGRLRVQPHGVPVRSRWMRPSRAAQLYLSGADPIQTWAILEPAAPVAVMRQGAVSSFRRAVALLSLEREALWGLAMYAAAVGLLSLATPLTIQILINWLSFGALQQPLLVLSLGLLLSLSLAALLRGLMRAATEMLQRRIFVRTVLDLAWRLPRVRVAAYDQAYGPELVNRFFDVLTVQKAVGALFLDGMGAALGAAVGMTLLAFYHPILLGFAVTLALSAAFILFVLGRGAEKTAIKESKAKYRVAGWLEELARHPLVFKLGGEGLAQEQADTLAQGYLSYREAHFRVFFRQFVGSLGMQVVASAALLGLCGWLVLSGQLTIGQLVAAEFIVTSALLNFSKLTDKLESLYDLLAAADKLGSLVDLPLESARGIWIPVPEAGAAVTLREVGFAYPGGTSLLSGLRLDIQGGERVAILGGDASGKSTLAELLLGVRSPTSGVVCRDGVDLRELQPARYLNEAALLRGEEIIIGTVEENISLGRPGVDATAVMQCLALTGLAESVSRLPEGLSTVLHPDGKQLSGETRRRLMLARAIAGQPRLIVVDGWLDRCDPETADALLATLAAPEQPWTLIVLTEDERLTRRLTRRLTLSGGRIHALELCSA